MNMREKPREKLREADQIVNFICVLSMITSLRFNPFHTFSVPTAKRDPSLLDEP